MAFLKRPHNFLFLVFFALFSCIEGIDVFHGDNNALVIDGSVTNEPGIHIVKVYYTTGFNVRSDFVATAQVSIVDDSGNRETLSYTKYGQYTTAEDFAGQFGRSYYVEVILKTGATYRSDPVVMTEPPEIDKVWFERGNQALNVFAQFTDELGEKNYYRWRYKGTYETLAPNAEYPFITCWSNVFDSEFLNLESDQFYDGKTVESSVGSIGFDRKLEYGYYLKVQLQSISKQTYDFLKAVSDQIGNTGTIFETAPYQLGGMIYDIENPKNRALGVFQVSGVKSKAIFIDEYTGRFGPIDCTGNPTPPARCYNCLQIGVNPTNVKPDFWPR